MNRIKNYSIALLSTLLIVVGFFYSARGLTDIYDKDTDIKAIIADGGLATLVGFIVVVLLCELAIANTLTHNDILIAKEAKGIIIEQITPDLGKGHTFCDVRNEQERKLRKETVIRKYFIDLESYEDYVKQGGLKNKGISIWAKISLWRMERKIKKINYDTYSFEEILNGVDKPELKKKKRVTLKGLRTKKYSKKIVTSVCTGMVFGYYGLKLAEEPNWGMVIYLAIQFIVFIANGMVQYFFVRSEMLTDYRDQIKADTNFLCEFKGSLFQHPEWYIDKPKIDLQSALDNSNVITSQNEATPLEEKQEHNNANLGGLINE